MQFDPSLELKDLIGSLGYELALLRAEYNLLARKLASLEAATKSASSEVSPLP